MTTTPHRLILTVTDLDDPYTQVWTLRDKPELWDFLNRHAQMNSGTTPKYKKNWHTERKES